MFGFLSPEAIAEKAKTAGRTFWSTFEDEVRNNKAFSTISKTLDFMNQGHSPTVAKTLGMAAYMGPSALIGATAEKLGTEIFKGFTRSGASLWTQGFGMAPWKPVTPLEKNFLGDEEIKPYGENVSDAIKSGYKFADWSNLNAPGDKKITGLGFGIGFAGLSALDFTPAGEGKQAIKLAGKAKGEFEAAVKIADELLDARKAAKAGAEVPFKQQAVEFGKKATNQIVDFSAQLARDEKVVDKAYQSRQVVSAEDVANELKSLGTAGGASDFLLDQVRSAGSYTKSEVNIKELLKRDGGIADYIRKGGEQLRRYSGPANMDRPIIIGPDGDVLDGFNRIHRASKEGIEKLPAYIADSQVTKPSVGTIDDLVDYSLDYVKQAGQFMDDQGVTGAIQDMVQKGYRPDHFGMYLIAQQADDVAKAGFKTGLSDAEIQALKGLSHVYEPYAQKIYSANKAMRDMLVENGVWSREFADKLEKLYPKWVPLKRVMEVFGESSGSRAIGGLSEQTIARRLVGSEREIEDPLESLFGTYTQAFQQATKNKLAQTYADFYKAPGNPLGIKPIRTVEMVKERIRLAEQYTKASDSYRSFVKDGKAVNKDLKALAKKSAKVEEDYKSIMEEAAVRAAEFDSESKLWDLIEKADTRLPKMEELARKTKLAEGDKQLYETLANEQKAAMEEIRQELMQYKEPARDLSQGTLSLYRDGVKELYEISPEAATAMKMLGVESMNLITRVTRLAVRTLKFGTSGVSAPFAVANAFFRDLLGGLLNTPNSLRVLKNYPKALGVAAAHDSWWLPKKYRVNADKIYDELVRNSAGGTSWDVVRGEEAKTLQDIISRASLSNRLDFATGVREGIKAYTEGGIKAGAKAAFDNAHPLQFLGSVIRDVEDFFGRSEEMGRLAQYLGNKEAFLKAGYTEEEATQQAARVARWATANFRRHGESSRALDALIAYFGASIQGSRATVRAAKADPKWFATKFMTMVGVPTAIVTLYNLMDDDRRKAYNSLNDYEKENNLVFVSNDAAMDPETRRFGGVFKFPLNSNLGAAQTLIRAGIEKLVGNNSPEFDKDLAKKLFDQLVGTVSPIEPSKKGLMNNFATQLFRPTLEVVSNYNFFTELPVVPQRLQNLLPEDQRIKGETPESAAVLSRALRAMGVNMNPIQTDHWIRGTFGSAASTVLNATDRGAAALGLIDESQVGGRGVMEDLSRRLFSASGGADEKGVQDEITQYQLESNSLSYRRTDAAQELLKKLPSLQGDERRKYLLEQEQKYPGIIEKAADIAKGQALGMTTADKRVQSLGVENGTRARYIYDHWKKIKDPEEKRAYLTNLALKRILTDDVAEQVVTLLVQDQAK